MCVRVGVFMRFQIALFHIWVTWTRLLESVGLMGADSIRGRTGHHMVAIEGPGAVEGPLLADVKHGRQG